MLTEPPPLSWATVVLVEAKVRDGQTVKAVLHSTL